MDFILEVSGLVVSYNGRLALEGVSFAVERGEGVAVVGPNGAGKTTLFRAIVGLVRPVAGTIRLAPEDRSSRSTPSGSANRQVQLAYLPQRSQVDWAFPVTVADVVMLGLIRRIGWLRLPGRRERLAVREALEQVGLGHLAGRQIGALSGGEQQRMFLARAIVQGAELLLLDESLTGLDAAAQEEILQLLEGLRERGGVTVLLATHDLNLAGARFDRVMLLNRRLLGLGKAEEVLTPERLRAAYGAQLRLVQTAEGLTVLCDTCCQEGQ
ncbi:MAG: metal ABC transporter ATP-binding protein [Candidatus Bipolaricaulia bacterium]